MIRHLAYILLAILLTTFATSTAFAQFINLRLTVEPELRASIIQPLDFGTQITNSGRTRIQLGDANMGIFSVRAYHTQNIYIELQYPDALENNEPGVEADIPLELGMAYNNSGTDNPQNSRPLPLNKGLVSITQNTSIELENDVWKQMYIYVYGSIVIGNIPNGIYTGDIVLNLDYD
ncbi:hypothetical protein ACKGJO_05745 [Gracilimonas sp. Q87]|uniref:hypothetical protein n=1 Tax=Gracilimonas sp. Q87 TaxID=3384766 RepID=UPI0039845BBA